MAWLLLHLVLLGGCGGAPPAGLPAEASQNVSGALEARGEEIFRREQCARCHATFDAPHGPAAAPPAPRAPATLEGRVGPDLGLEGHRRSDDWHAAHLYAPEVVVPGSRMPASRHLFQPGGALPPRLNDDGRALVAWLQGLGRARRDMNAEFRAAEPPIPEPLAVPRDARLARGRALYGQWCVPCHGESGDGRGPAAALLALPPRDLTRSQFRFRSTLQGARGDDADLFRVLTLGTGTGAAMPSFGGLDAEERWALVLYARELAPATRGADLRPPPTPSAMPGVAGSALAAEGRRLYAAWGCAACHGAAGEGKPFDDRTTRGDGEPVTWASDLRHACARRGGGSTAAFERALRFGVGPAMPSFAAVLEQEPRAAAAMVAWLEGTAAKETPPVSSTPARSPAPAASDRP